MREVRDNLFDAQPSVIARAKKKRKMNIEHGTKHRGQTGRRDY